MPSWIAELDLAATVVHAIGTNFTQTVRGKEMSKFIVLAMENGRRQYINTDQIRCVYDQKDEDTVVIAYDDNHKEYFGRERAAPLLRWLKTEASGGS